MEIKQISIQKIKPYKNNPRKNDEAIEPLMASIKKFGFRVPIVIDKDNVIVAGHTRYKAAKRLKMDMIPVVRAENLTEKEAAAYRLIDNKTQEFAGWQFDELITELEGLEIDMSDFGFDLRSVSNEKKEKKENIGATELNIDDFSDDSFDYECPYCGFRFNG